MKGLRRYAKTYNVSHISYDIKLMIKDVLLSKIDEYVSKLKKSFEINDSIEQTLAEHYIEVLVSTLEQLKENGNE